jgi:hypothetical protein
MSSSVESVDIVFPSPVFFCPEDEDRFFEWIHSLPAYESILGKGTELTLRLRDPVDAGSSRQLRTVFRRWELDSSLLDDPGLN